MMGRALVSASLVALTGWLAYIDWGLFAIIALISAVSIGGRRESDA